MNNHSSVKGLRINKTRKFINSKMGIKVNSKYGKWNADNASIQASDATDGAVTEQP